MAGAVRREGGGDADAAAVRQGRRRAVRGGGAGRSFGGASCGSGGGGGGGGGAEDQEEEGTRFVGWFREAWPYVRGHRGSTFVVVVSGEVVAGPHLDGILQVSPRPALSCAIKTNDLNLCGFVLWSNPIQGAMEKPSWRRGDS